MHEHSTENLKSEFKIRTQQNEIWLDERGILRVLAFDGADIDIEETIACFNAYKQLGCTKTNKLLQLIDGRDNMSITHEARNYAALHGKDFFIASAIVNNSLAVRLIVNFFNRFYKEVVPFKMFATEQEAINWLITFK